MSGPSSANPGAVLTAVNTARRAARRGGLRPVLTAAPPGALLKLGRDGEKASSQTEKQRSRYGPLGRAQSQGSRF